jgi:integrase/recombinase XerD
MKIVEVKSKNGTNFMILDGNNEPIVDAVRGIGFLGI